MSLLHSSTTISKEVLKYKKNGILLIKNWIWIFQFFFYLANLATFHGSKIFLNPGNRVCFFSLFSHFFYFLKWRPKLMECQKTPKSQWNNFLLKKFKIGSKPFKEGSSRTTRQNFKILMDIWWWSCPKKPSKRSSEIFLEKVSTMNGIQKWQVYSFLISADFFFVSYFLVLYEPFLLVQLSVFMLWAHILLLLFHFAPSLLFTLLLF